MLREGIMSKPKQMVITTKELIRKVFYRDKSLAKIIYEEGQPFKLLLRKRLLSMEEWKKINEMVEKITGDSQEK